LRLDPNSVRHRQKQVEFAFKSGDKAKLIDAYVELADTLLRSDLPDKARAVYKRVAEHDPANERAKAALAMPAPVTTRPPEPPAPDGKLRSSEALGVCFLDKGAFVVAESILRRALDLPAAGGDQERLGVLYWLGRALEEQGKRVEARELYGRVFAVDIRFRDV